MDPTFADQVLKAAVENGNDPKKLQAHLDSLDAAGQENMLNEMATVFKMQPQEQAAPRKGRFVPDAQANSLADKVLAVASGVKEVVPGVDELVGFGSALGSKAAEAVHGIPSEPFQEEFDTGRKEFQQAAEQAGTRHPGLEAAGTAGGFLAQVPVAVQGAVKNALIGAAMGAAEGDSAAERTLNAGIGLGLGAVAGIAGKSAQKQLRIAADEVSDKFSNLVKFSKKQKDILGPAGLEKAGMALSEAGEAAKNPATLQQWTGAKADQLASQLKDARVQSGIEVPRQDFIAGLNEAANKLKVEPVEAQEAKKYIIKKMQEMKLLAKTDSHSLDEINSFANFLDKGVNAYETQTGTAIKKNVKAISAQIRDLVGKQLGPQYQDASHTLKSLIITNKALESQNLASRFPGPVSESTSALSDLAQAAKGGLTTKINMAAGAAVDAFKSSPGEVAIALKIARDNATKPTAKLLLNAAQRGPAAVSAMHFMLMNRDSDYRKMMQDSEQNE